ITAAPQFPGLCRFSQGCGFKQWMGDDSKALMKVCTWCWKLASVSNTQRRT
ncbi:hypothetical protein L208DRAFT_1245543, partial [Tricholoma matsutake]